jgi:hypothetical protein
MLRYFPFPASHAGGGCWSEQVGEARMHPKGEGPERTERPNVIILDNGVWEAQTYQ